MKGQSEIDQLQVQRLVVEKQKILRLEVSVRNVMGMAVAESLDNLHKQFPGIGFSEIANFVQSVEQLPSAAETTIRKGLLSDQEYVGLIFEGFVKFDT